MKISLKRGKWLKKSRKEGCKVGFFAQLIAEMSD
jgi:hypothetical protein